MTQLRRAQLRRTLIAAQLVLVLSGCIVPVPIYIPGGAPVVVGYTAAAQSAPGPGPASARCPTPGRTATLGGEVIARVNAERTSRGLAALHPSGRLARVAQAHACDNAARGGYSHTGSDGSDLPQRLRRGGYAYRTAAENTGLGFDAPDRLVAFWMNSPHHRDNILNRSVTEIGVGLADGARPAWVLDLARSR